jgi:hypothetical protein
MKTKQTTSHKIKATVALTIALAFLIPTTMITTAASGTMTAESMTLAAGTSGVIAEISGSWDTILDIYEVTLFYNPHDIEIVDIHWDGTIAETYSAGFTNEKIDLIPNAYEDGYAFTGQAFWFSDTSPQEVEYSAKSNST